MDDETKTLCFLVSAESIIKNSTDLKQDLEELLKLYDGIKFSVNFNAIGKHSEPLSKSLDDMWTAFFSDIVESKQREILCLLCDQHKLPPPTANGLCKCFPYVSVFYMEYFSKNIDFKESFSKSHYNFLSECVLKNDKHMLCFMIDFVEQSKNHIDDAFVTACRRNEKIMATVLLTHLEDEDVNNARCQQYSSTALMHAVQNGHIDMVEWLLSLGANPLVSKSGGLITASYFIECCYNGTEDNKKKISELLTEAAQKQQEKKIPESDSLINIILHDMNLSDEKKMSLLRELFKDDAKVL